MSKNFDKSIKKLPDLIKGIIIAFQSKCNCEACKLIRSDVKNYIKSKAKGEGK